MSFRGEFVDEAKPGRYRTAYLPYAPWNTPHFNRRTSMPITEGFEYRNKTYRNDVTQEIANTLMWAILVIGSNPMSGIYNKEIKYAQL